MRPFAALLLTAALCCGCSSTDGPRFFEPPRAVVSAAPATSHTLALHPTRSGQHLGDRIMWRRSAVEVGFYDQERWTQPPARYVDLALADALFVARGLRRVERGAALNVELVAFEEVLLPDHVAYVELRALLTDAEGAALLEEVVRVRTAVAQEEAESMATTLGKALDQAVGELADAVLARLTRSS